MTSDEMIEKIDSLSPEQRKALLDDVAWDVDEAVARAEDALEVPSEPVEPKAEKVKCKVCGFAKKSRRVTDGVCKSCRTALDSTDGEYAADAEVQVVGRMGKRGRNTVSIVIDGRRWKVKRLSPKHSERVAAHYASKSKGYAKAAKRTGDAPKGLPTDSRIGADREQRTYED